MSFFSVDVESAGGRIPGVGHMTALGVVLVQPGLNEGFFGFCCQCHVSDIPTSVVLDRSRENQEANFLVSIAADRAIVMQHLAGWLQKVNERGRPIMWSDNPAYDFQWIDHGFYPEENPFGHTARRIGDFYAGLATDTRASVRWKDRLRRTPHTHNPLDDAMGNAEALLALLHVVELFHRPQRLFHEETPE